MGGIGYIVAKKKDRIDTSSQAEDLTDNPFAALGGLFSEDERKAKPVPTGKPAAEILYKVKRSYNVTKTRKGGWPVRKEKRGAGNTVTVLSGVSGDRKALLQELQKARGVGGQIDGNTVVLQGDHVSAIEVFLGEAFQQ